MTEVTAKFKIIIISLMIVAGAINTIGTLPTIQPRNFRINKWSIKALISNTFSIPICK
jgi:hypothetical protein